MKKKEETCNDKNCPFHGSIKVRGMTFTGTIISDKMSKTATVELVRRRYIPKYERYEIKKKKVHVHNPSCISATKGNKVKIKECRPLSKTKNFVIVEVLQ